eukprot:GILJ01008813.1.p1 GENE.GILJ01008813.1~~GILJ01008813.1.p1  ORF type:complete len:2651 (-),score=491.70 GILJ01008813.1:182-7681(-)
MERLAKALEEVDDPNIDWRVRYQLTISKCYEEAARPSEAMKAADTAAALCKKHSGLLEEEVLRVRVALNRDNRKVLDVLRKEAESFQSAGSRYVAVVAMLRAGAVPDSQIEGELRPVLQALEPLSLPENVQTQDRSKAAAWALEALAEASRVCIAKNQITLAESISRCVLRASGVNVKARVYAEFTQAELRLRKRGGERDPKTGLKLEGAFLLQYEYSKRAEALKILDRALLSARRTEDWALQEEGCILVWNVALPLLHASQRSHAHKALTTATDLLEDIDSNLTGLRVQLHLELAKCEMQLDFLSKAQAHITKALALDPTIPQEQLTLQLLPGEDPAPFLRPLDRYIVPLAHKLQLKLNIYGDPDLLEDQALLLIEQAREAEGAVRATLLRRALQMLETSIQQELSAVEQAVAQAVGRASQAAAPDVPSEPVAVATGSVVVAAADKSKRKGRGNESAREDLSERGGQAREAVKLHEVEGAERVKQNGIWLKRRRERSFLLGSIAKLALAEQLLEVAGRAADLMLEGSSWDPLREKDLVILQSEVHFIRVEVYAAVVSDYYIELGTTSTEQHFESILFEDDDEPIQPEPLPESEKSLVLAAKKQVLRHLVEGMRLAVAAHQPWLIQNAAIQLWNKHLHLFRDKRFSDLLPELVTALEDIHKALHSLHASSTAPSTAPAASAKPTDNKNAATAALSQAANQSPADIMDRDPALLCQISLVLGLIFEFRNEVDKAEAACQTAVACAGPAEKKDVLMLLTRLQQRKGTLVLPSTAAAAGKGQTVTASTVGSDLIQSQALTLLQVIMSTQDVTKKRELLQRCQDILTPWVPQEDSEYELEAHAELWTRLARAALDVNLTEERKRALLCAEKAFAAVSKGDHGKVTPRRWRWFSLAHSAYGQALSLLVQTDKQEKESQNQLLFQSLEHLCKSAQYGTKSGTGSLVLSASRLAWNVSLPLLNSAFDRPHLIEPLHILIQELAAVGEETDMELRVCLYRGLFDCICTTEEWARGEMLVDEAFQHVPVHLQRVLWEARMEFLSKQGKDVAAAMVKMKEASPVLQALVWVKLARASSNPLDQHSAYQKAIDILRNAESMEEVETIMELGEWLYRCDWPHEAVENQLLTAADLLLDIAMGDDEDDDEEDKDGGRTIVSISKRSRKPASVSGRSVMSRTSRSSRGSIAKKSVVSRRSMVSKAKSRGPHLSHRSSHTRQTKAGSHVNRMQEGGRPEQLNISNWEQLFRIHMMLARTASTANQRMDYCLLAHHFLLQMWFNSVDHVNQIESTLLAASNGQTIDEDQPLTVVEVHKLPCELADWLTFKPSPELLSRFREAQGPLAINKTSIEKPELTVFYLRQLLTTLEKEGYHLHCGPVLCTLSVLASEVLELAPLAHLTTLQLARLLETMQLTEASAHELTQVGSLRITNEQRASFEEEFQRHTKHRARYNEKNGSTTTVPLVLSAIRIHEMWLEHAKEMLHWGQLAVAKELLTECLRHSQCFQDHAAEAESLTLLSTVATVEGDIVQALSLQQQAQDVGTSIQFWVDSAITSAQLLLQIDRLSEAKNVLKHAIRLLSQSETRMKKGELDIVEGLARVETHMAQVLLREACVFASRQAPFDALLSEAFALMQAASDRLQKRGGGAAYWRTLVAYANLLLEAPRLSFAGKGQSMETVQAMADSTRKSRMELALTLVRLADKQTTEVVASARSPTVPLHVSLPLMRELASHKIQLAGMELELSELERSIALRAEMKQESGEEVPMPVCEGRDSSLVDRWAFEISKQIDAQRQTVSSELSREERSVTLLSSALSLLPSIHPVYSEADALKGRALRLLAERNGLLHRVWVPTIGNETVVETSPPLVPGETDKKDSTLVAAPAPVGVGVGVSRSGASTPLVPQDPDLSSSPPETVPRASRVHDQRGGVPNVSYDHQAEATLLGALVEAQSKGSWEAVSIASEELLCLYGTKQPLKAFQQLAFFQSAQTRRRLEALLLSASSPLDKDKLFIEQLQRLQRRLLRPQQSEVVQKLMSSLQVHSDAWRVLNLESSWEQLVAWVPPDTAVVILQHSSDGRAVYGGVWVAGSNAAMVVRMQLNDDRKLALDQLLQQLKTQCAALRKTLAEQREHTPAALLQDLDQQFDSVFFEVEQWFAPLTALLQPVLQRAQQPVTLEPADVKDAKVNPGKKAGTASGSAGSTSTAAAATPACNVLVCADMELLSLPLETLHMFTSARSVSRDFSLHVFCQRCKNLRLVDMIPSSSAGVKLPPEVCGWIDRQALRYVVDPRADDFVGIDSNNSSIMSAFEAVKSQVITSSWRGTIGNDHVPSIAEWQSLLCTSSAFTFVGFNRLLAHIGTSHVAGLSLRRCVAAVVLDQLENETSYRRQSKDDTKRSPEQLAMESPVALAALLTLRGVNSVVCTQWCSAWEEARFILSGIWSQLQSGRYLGEAVRDTLFSSTTPVPSQTPAAGGPSLGANANVKRANGDSGAQLVTPLPSLRSFRSKLNSVVYGVPAVKLG